MSYGKDASASSPAKAKGDSRPGPSAGNVKTGKDASTTDQCKRKNPIDPNGVKKKLSL